MFLIRPVALSDLNGLEQLAYRANAGITSLPKNRALLEKRLFKSMRSFSSHIKEPIDELYLFMLEDLEEKKIIGTSAIMSRTGVTEPFYCYRLTEERRVSTQMDIETTLSILHLVEKHDGPSEVGTLYLHPRYRKGGLGRLLSLSRFLFMACHPERIDTVVLAEMRGYIEENGVCPFWEKVGRHFFHMDFAYANLLRCEDQTFIRDLIPPHPIYVPLLSKQIQETVGKTHPHTIPGLKLLEQEGFRVENQIDIFDAGPHVHCETKDLRIVREHQRRELVEIGEVGEEEELQLVANTDLDFRCCLAGVLPIGDTGVKVAPEVAKALHLEVGSSLCYAALRAKKKLRLKFPTR